MSDSRPIRVMTVDDHEVMRGGIRFALLACVDLELIAEARSGRQALELCGTVQPDVILMDMKMPGMDGVATTKGIKAAFPDVQVLVFTSFHDRELVRSAMQAGAIGYVLKDVSTEELAQAIRSAHAGRTTLSSDAAQDLVAGSGPENESFGGQLTPRELEVLALLVEGLSNQAIGKRLHRSQHTVRNHVSQIIHKLGAANRSEAAVLAIRHQLVSVVG